MPLPQQPSFGPRAVAFGRWMAEIPGHYRVAVELYLAGDLPGAVLHASHPLMEVLPSVYEDLLEHGLAAEIARGLGRAASVVRERKPITDVNGAFEAATRISGESIQAVVGPAAATPAYNASVMAGLLRAAVRKYGLGTTGTRVTLLPEYQDAYGFLRQAHRMADALNKAAPQADWRSLIEELEALERMVPGPKGPEEVVSFGALEAAADRIGEELRDHLGAILRETPTPMEALHRIEYRLALLADVLRHDETGRAERLVARMYAEDYVDLQPSLAAAAPEIDAELGPLLGRELRLQIDRGEPYETIATTVRRVIELLEETISAIGEE